MFSKIFKVLDLADKDERIYSTAIGLTNFQPASVLAQRAGLNRVDVYNHLKILTKKGVFLEKEKNGIKHYKACPINKLQALINVKKTRISEAQRHLQDFYPNILSRTEKNANIKKLLFKGEEEIIELLERFENSRSRILRFFGSTLNIAGVKIGANNIDHYIQNRIKLSIQLRQIVPVNDVSKNLQAQDGRALRLTKYLPKKSDPRATILMYDDEVIILPHDDPNTGILIKNQQFADVFQGIFDMFWVCL